MPHQYKPTKKIKHYSLKQLKLIRKDGFCSLNKDNPVELGTAHAHVVNVIIERLTHDHKDLEPVYIRWVLDNPLKTKVQETVMFLATHKNEELH